MKISAKIALIGYGKMGRRIGELALEQGHSIVIIDRSAKEADFKKVSKAALKDVWVAIDFSAPEGLISNLSIILSEKVPLVIGTTGWNQDLKKVETLVKKANGHVLWGANFSVGMNLFMKIVQESARLISQFDQYEVAGFEVHHSAKKDNPSGTALKLAHMVASEYQKNSKNKKPVEFSGVRVGKEPGTHTLLFDSAIDTLELTHRARSRDGFAQGALLGAAWIQEQKTGLYSFENHFEDMIP